MAEGRELWELSATEQATGIRQRRWSSVDVARSVLERIAHEDVETNAYCTVNPSLMQEAQAADELLRSAGDVGPLHGAPFSVKDLIPTAGLRTTLGSLANLDWIPSGDEISVARLRQSGLVLTGKTNTRELGYGVVTDNRVFGPTANPWSTALTATGSSGGAAAAVASGMASVALGTDGGGSVRVPASACGVLGFKPTFGVVAMYPTARVPLRTGLDSWSSLECVGVLSRSADDLRAAYDLIRGADPRDELSVSLSPVPPDAEVRPLRVALSHDLGWCTPSRTVVQVVSDAVAALGDSLGWEITEVTPSLPDLATAREAFACAVAHDTDLEALRRLAAEVEVSEDIEELVRAAWPAARLVAGRRTREDLARTMHELLRNHDVLITPTLATTPFPIGLRVPPDGWGGLERGADWSPFAFLSNLTGQPALSVPAGLSPEGLPIGMQLVGPAHSDLRLLDLAAQVERARPWPACWR